MLNKQEQFLKGIVTKIITQKPEFTSFYIEDENHHSYRAVTSEEDIVEGDVIEITGYIKNDRRYGLQFKVTNLKLIERSQEVNEQDREKQKTVNKLLAIKKVGPKLAEKIYEHLGANAIEEIISKPDALDKVPGVGKKTAEFIRQQVKFIYGNRKFRKTIEYLEKLGLDITNSQKVWDHFFRSKKIALEDFVAKVNENPYILTEALQFEAVDNLAQDKFLIKKDSSKRLEAAVMEGVKEVTINRGNVYGKIDHVVKRAKKLIEEIDGEESFITEENIKDSLFKLVDKNELHVPLTPSGNPGQNVYIKKLFFAEIHAARRLKEIRQTTPVPKHLETLIKKYEINEGITLDKEQRQAVRSFWENRFSILVGLPGTGKTTTLKSIIYTATELDPSARILLLAPTANAAKLMSKVTGGIPAYTMHKGLNIHNAEEGSDYHYLDNPLPYDIVIVDEASLMGTMMFKNLLMAIGNNTRVLLIGDYNQLPSVSAGKVLYDLTQTMPFVELKTIHRQPEESSIPYICRDILEGRVPEFKYDDAEFIEENDPEKIKQIIFDKLNMYGDKKGDNVQVLSPRKQGVDLSVEDLNPMLQEFYNRENRSQYPYWYKDKVVQTENRYDLGVINGDIGEVKTINDEEIEVYFKDEDISVSYPLGVISDNLELAYSLTVHKAEGLQFPVVIIPLILEFGKNMLSKQMVYTAFSRPKEKLIVIGEKAALELAVKNDVGLKRLTSLRKRIESSD
ncbi:MAG: AAA family ATPase [Thermosipho sp. (in: Bacteria)]|nr:AAA family ATPase [Thermosipho sp. (in: thermotogales)]